MLAVIEISGKQYRVEPGTIITVDKLQGEIGALFEVERVLLTENRGQVTIGQPAVKGAKATLKIIKQFQGEKIHIRRYKQKVRYRKARGFRPQLTKLEVVSIT
jgi:large subunit ribosomal protein L21